MGVGLSVCMTAFLCVCGRDFLVQLAVERGDSNFCVDRAVCVNEIYPCVYGRERGHQQLLLCWWSHLCIRQLSLSLCGRDSLLQLVIEEGDNNCCAGRAELSMCLCV